MNEQERRARFDALVAEAGPMLKGFVIARIPGTDAEDVLSNIWLAVWTSLESFRGESALRTWAYRIAVHKVMEFYRWQYRQRRLLEKVYEELCGEVALAEVPIPQGSARGLTAGQFAVFKLIGQGMRNGEISKALFISDNTVRSHIKAINKALRLNGRDRVRLALFAAEFLRTGNVPEEGKKI